MVIITGLKIAEPIRRALMAKIGEWHAAVLDLECPDKRGLKGSWGVGGEPCDQKVTVVCELPNISATPVPDGFTESEPAVLNQSLAEASTLVSAGRRLAYVHNLGVANPCRR